MWRWIAGWSAIRGSTASHRERMAAKPMASRVSRVASNRIACQRKAAGHFCNAPAACGKTFSNINQAINRVRHKLKVCPTT